MFKNKITIKIISVAICFIISFTFLAGAEIKVDHASALGFSTITDLFAKNFIEACMRSFGGALVDMAEETGDPEKIEIASTINKFVFGGNTSAKLKNITETCEQILDLVEEIDANLTKYTSDLQKTMGEDRFKEYYDDLDSEWSEDVYNFENEYNIKTTLNKYEDYMQEANDYVYAKSDEEDLADAKEELFEEFVEMYCSKGNKIDDEHNTYEGKQELIFCDNTIDSVITSAINDMLNSLERTSQTDNTYVDTAAQFAYVAFPFADEQYDFVYNSMLSQMAEILLLEMMYEEFLAQRSEFYSENYKDNEVKTNSMKTYISKFNKLNEKIAEGFSNYLEMDIKVNVSSNGELKLNINDYVKSQDVGLVELKNTEFKSLYKNVQDTYFEGYFDNKRNEAIINLKAKYYDDSVYFDKISTMNSDGINTYYVLSDDNKCSMNMNSILSRYFDEDIMIINNQVTYWDYRTSFGSADYLNLTQCTYTDGSNSYKSIENSSDLTNIFDNNFFKVVGSTPINALSEQLGYASGDNLYVVTSDYDIKYNKFKWDQIYDVNGYIDSVNLSKKQPSFPFETTQYNCEEAISDGYSKQDKYTVILKQEDEEKENTYILDTKVTGEGSADVFIKTLNEEELQNSTSVVTKPNDKVEISFKAEENTKINSLSLVNNDTKEVVSTVTGDEIEYSLIADEKGYYNIGYSTSYSNYSVVLDTQLKHKIEIKSITGMDTGVITFDESINPEMILKDEKVEFTVSEDITEMYVNTIDDKNKLILETLDDGSKKVSFTMPNEDVCLLYKSSKSEFSQDEDNYNLIKSYSDLENAIKVYNNAIVKDHNFRLANDITAPEDSVLTTSFGEDEPFNGVFDGNSHKISNLTLSPKCTSLFANLTGTIKDLEVESNIVVDSYKDEVKSNYSGLVDYAQNASIENIDVDVTMDINGYLSTSTYVGGVVSRAFDSTINNCTANGEMTVNNFSTIFIGGIAGTTESTDITNCTNNANISNYYVKTVNGGGIVGKDENSTIQNVVNNANISNSFIIENSNTGGICGISTESEIKSSQNKGAIILDGAETINSGGIVGVGQSTNFENVINDGNITATTNDYYYIDSIGGIVGMSTAPLMIASCTNNATLSSDSTILYIGGILGKGQASILNSQNLGILETLENTNDDEQGTYYINSSDMIGLSA